MYIALSPASIAGLMSDPIESPTDHVLSGFLFLQSFLKCPSVFELTMCLFGKYFFAPDSSIFCFCISTNYSFDIPKRKILLA